MRIKLGTPIRLCTIPDIVSGVASHPLPSLQVVTHLSTNSAEVKPGDLFVALTGDTHDGHHYIDAAIANGAAVILCRTGYVPHAKTAYYIYAEKPIEALAALAQAYIDKIPHTTIAVTGSVGKTTTRHYIATLLRQKYRVHECPNNYNNLLGVSLTLLTAPPDIECLVLELGMDGSGQISRLSRLVHPDIAVITNVGVSHIEKLGSQKAICQAKLEILDGIRDGKLLIEGNDTYLSVCAPENAITVSANCHGAMCHSAREAICATGTTFDFLSPIGKWQNLHIPSLGRHTLSCALFAITVAQMLSLSEEQVREGLCRYEPVYQRQTTLYVGDITIVLDAYNACPASMKGAIDTIKLLSDASNGRAIALLGDMLELGPMSQRYHEEIGAYAAEIGVEYLFLVGSFSNAYRLGALQADMNERNIICLSSAQAREIVPYLAPHDILLIKGSRKNKLELLLPDLQKALTS